MSDKEIIPAGFFRDAVNPTDEEIVRWAYIEGAHYPPEMTQDWDLCVVEPRRADLMLRLALDEKCPTRGFFLSCLYLMVGDSVRSKGRTWPLQEVSQWVERHRQEEHPVHIVLFFQRTRELLTKPEAFDYNKWCCWGGDAYGIDDDALKEERETAPKKCRWGCLVLLPVLLCAGAIWMGAWLYLGHQWSGRNLNREGQEVTRRG